MESSGNPHLLTDVRFSVSRKGYDPDEVDNFLERVSAAVAQLQDKLRQATAAAEAAEGRAAEAVRNEARLQQRLSELEGGAAPIVRAVDPEIEAQQASTVLVMAQRTADSTVNDARSKAAQLVAEAEQEATRILGTAQARADEAVLELERNRRELATENEALKEFLADERQKLQSNLARIKAVLDDPAMLRLGNAPVDTAAIVDAPAPAPAAPAEPPKPPVSVSTPAPATPPAEEFVPVLAESDWSENSTLFESDEDAGGPPTRALLFGDDDDEFLSTNGDDSDEAMRRFFDNDFDNDDRFNR